MRLASRLVVLRAGLLLRAAARRRRRRLEGELADYRSPADRLELEAMLDRYPPGATAEIHEILARQRRDRELRRHPFRPAA